LLSQCQDMVAMVGAVVAVADEYAHRKRLGLFGRAHGMINVGERRQ
jgi:hypothetical protein